MSTEHQRYSTQNQMEAIRKYAEARGIAIVRTYADEGKSGLRLDNRDALKQLLNDVRSGRANFRIILVYDVSRWGRFQDADESAYYEFACKEAGIAVHYCAEQFENDGSLTATVIKGIKRAMAGEYSRELSHKVFVGHCRLSSLGFRQGGVPGYGLRRQLVDERGQPKMQLRSGERKSIQTDRVVLVPGPNEEIETIRCIYRMFVEERVSPRQIAARLNAAGGPPPPGQAWTRPIIAKLLQNEQYIGNYVYNRTSYKFKKYQGRNPPEAWVRAEGAFPPVVDRPLFELAQQIIAERRRRLTDAEVLNKLRTLLAKQGSLSSTMLRACDGVPSHTSCQRRFGSLRRAYELIGYSGDRDYQYISTGRHLRTVLSDIVTELVGAIERAGGAVVWKPETRRLTINGEYTALIVIAKAFRGPRGALRWKINPDAGQRPDITIVLRMDRENRSVQDYYLLPRFACSAIVRLREKNGLVLEAYRRDTLASFVHMAVRARVRRIS